MLICTINNIYNKLPYVYISLITKPQDLIKIMVSSSLHKYLNISKQNIDTDIIKWNHCKKYINPYEYIHTPPYSDKQGIAIYEPISRSFFKLIEIINQFNIFEYYKNVPISSFHLAEGPGGFIEAMLYMRNNDDDKYYGITLKSLSDNVPSWDKIKCKFPFNKHIVYEEDSSNDGDLMQPINFIQCVKKYKNSMQLITADGGFDFSVDYKKQEICSSKLILAQIIYALMIQKHQGSFILKMFDIFYKVSLEMIYILKTFYASVTICKPKTSRFANSEKYIICKGFLYTNTSEYYNTFLNILTHIENEPIHVSIASLLNFDLPLSFTQQIEELNCIFGKKQLRMINSTMQLVNNKQTLDKVNNYNIDKCVQWCINNKIPVNNHFDNKNIFTKHL